jgi:hypothetical protein
MSNHTEYLSFKDFVPQIKLKDGTRTLIHLSKYVRNRLRVYKRRNNLISDSHAVHSLIIENEMLRSLMWKMDVAIKRAIQEDNVDFFIVVLYEHASNQEKAMFDMIRRGALI